MIGDRKILMPIADAQQLMVIADDFCVLMITELRILLLILFAEAKHIMMD